MIDHPTVSTSVPPAYHRDPQSQTFLDPYRADGAALNVPGKEAVFASSSIGEKGSESGTNDGIAYCPFHIEIDRETLQRALAHILSIVDKRHSLMILQHVLLSARSSTLTVTATDMHIMVEEVIHTNIECDGTFALPLDTLHGIVRKMPNDAILTLVADPEQPGWARITSRDCEFMISYMDPSHFPMMGREPQSYHFELDASLFVKMIERTRSAMLLEDSHYALHGLCLLVDDALSGPVPLVTQQDARTGQTTTRDDPYIVQVAPSQPNHAQVVTYQERCLTMVAMDGHRMSTAQIPITPGCETMPRVIFPRKSVIELHKLLADYIRVSHGETAPLMRVELSRTKAVIYFGHITVVTRLVDAIFPEYTHVIPTHYQSCAVISRQALAKVVDRVTVVNMYDEARLVRFLLQDDILIVAAVGDKTHHQARETLPVQFHWHQPIEVAFNVRYILEYLESVRGEQVTFYFAADRPTESVVLLMDDDTAAPWGPSAIMPVTI